jgi:hypothetical protein
MYATAVSKALHAHYPQRIGEPVGILLQLGKGPSAMVPVRAIRDHGYPTGGVG